MRNTAFKQYERTQRVQTIETNYKLGMKYTDAPLPEGYNRLLVNLDIDTEGLNLTPRRGLKNTRSIPIDRTFSYSVRNGTTYQYPYFFVGGRESTLEAPDKSLYILGGFDVDRKSELCLYTKHSDRTTVTKTSAVKFLFPVDGKLHDMDINAQGVATAEHVGVFGWNDSYYCFNQETKQLQQTFYNTETEQFEFRPVEAYQPNATESTTWGYNMLLDEPYAFVDDFMDGAPNFFSVQGMSVYSPDDHTVPEMTLRMNKEYHYELRYAAGEGTYKLKWEYKEAGTDNWTTLGDDTEYTVTKNNQPKINVNFTSPYKNTVLVVTVSTKKESEEIVNAADGTPEVKISTSTTHSEKDGVVTDIVETTTKTTSTEVTQADSVTTTVRVNKLEVKADTAVTEAGSTTNTSKTTTTVKTTTTTTTLSPDGTTQTETFVVIDVQVSETAADGTVKTTTEQNTYTTAATSESDDVVKLKQVGYQFSYSADVDNTASSGLVNELKPIKYNLHTARGMAYWKRRLVVYDVEEDATVLFTSEPDNPHYFPYGGTSGMLDYFDEPIMNVVPFLDDLLVFTTSKLYRLTLASDGYTFTRVCLQTNLYITESETHFTQVVKNMLFFKSGNFFYMVVPKTTSGELVVAPISKPIEGFLNNFRTNSDDLLKQLYNCPTGSPFIYAYNYLDYEDVHNVYVFKAPYVYKNQGEDFSYYIHLNLLYNTVTRTWRAYVHESKGFMAAYRQDATKKGIQVSVSPTEGMLKFLEYAETYDCVDNDSVHFLNWQLLDSGYREHQTENKKRYREIQFRINNTSQTTLKFGMTFYIDGELRRGNYKWETEYIFDNEDKSSCIINLAQQIVYDPRLEVPGVTTLNPVYGVENEDGDIEVVEFEEDENNQTSEPLEGVKKITDTQREDVDNSDGGTTLGFEETWGDLSRDENPRDVRGWVLDQNMFPNVAFWKVRVPVSGKGYAPRIVLQSKNQAFFEFLGNTWVLRTMNSR